MIDQEQIKQEAFTILDKLPELTVNEVVDSMLTMVRLLQRYNERLDNEQMEELL